MSFLAWLLTVKVGVTFVAIAVPFLVLPAETLERLLGAGVSTAMARLYAIAILALLVAYGSGLNAALSGTFPSGIVWMGLVSNVGAAAVIMRHLRGLPRIVSGAFFGAIGIGFVAVRLFPTCLSGGGAC